ncbi:MAG: hypothetical protein ONB16_05175 [candidate division KSB1 bacterium]|nr:hypothetical protein [candidate division KSB1 bacterium]MDZ7340363.1 hypothetical protein [candidate division KSB1 bacterium]
MKPEELIDLKTKDIQKATLEARKKSMKVLEEQGIAAIALAVSEFLVKFVEQPESALEKLKWN